MHGYGRLRVKQDMTSLGGDDHAITTYEGEWKNGMRNGTGVWKSEVCSLLHTPDVQSIINQII